MKPIANRTWFWRTIAVCLDQDYFEETLEYCDVKIGPGYAGPKILALEEEFRLAAGRVRQETTTSNADDLGRLRDDAIQKAGEVAECR